MKSCFLILVLLAFMLSVYSQKNRIIDSLKIVLANSKEDIQKVQLLAELCDFYDVFNNDSCLYYAKQGLKIAQALKYKEGEAHMLYSIGAYYRSTGDMPQALKYFFEAQKIATEINSPKEISWSYLGMGLVYINLDSATSLHYLKKAKEYLPSNDRRSINLSARCYLNLGVFYTRTNHLDTAYMYLNDLYQNATPDIPYYSAIVAYFADLQFKIGNTDSALNLLHRSINFNNKIGDHFTAANTYNSIADIFKELKKSDSAIFYAQKGLDEATQIDRRSQMFHSADLLAELYEQKNLSQSYYYLKLSRNIYEGLYGSAKVQSLQKLVLEEQEQRQKTEQEQIANRNRLKQYLFFGGILILSLIALILYRNNIQRKKINNQLELTLKNLKATQSQLIQSEKMASLGELTAGIAHEIQNPLNFVNNFSGVSAELVKEMVEEVDKGNTEEVKAIANDVVQNLEKINHHGNRAADIVKGMLQHTRSSNGQKEPTDINALCDEYLRLSYHGLRAKDKSFKATMKTDFDESIDTINIVPQDIGRVVLNLINNAFYAVSENAKQNIAGYDPLVTVSTKKISPAGGGKGVEISVRDNGNGIPESIKEKIFQPFFTTKPTGQGTGLGLSLSYDIVKAHGGELKVETKEGEGSTFFIQFPTN